MFTEHHRCNFVPSFVRGSHVLRGLNRWLSADGYRTVDSAKLARSLRPGDLDHEIVAAFMTADELFT
jgi:hypothetical protein